MCVNEQRHTPVGDLLRLLRLDFQVFGRHEVAHSHSLGHVLEGEVYDGGTAVLSEKKECKAQNPVRERQELISWWA